MQPVLFGSTKLPGEPGAALNRPPIDWAALRSGAAAIRPNQTQTSHPAPAAENTQPTVPGGSFGDRLRRAQAAQATQNEAGKSVGSQTKPAAPRPILDPQSSFLSSAPPPISNNPFARPGEFVFKTSPTPHHAKSFTPGRAHGDKRPPNPNKPSDEQAAIRDCQDKVVIGNAFAGTGKTSTAVFFADARPNSKILYLAFNAPIVKEAREKFGHNVMVKTAHSMAFEATPDWMRRRVARPWRVGQFQDDMSLPSAREARLAMSVLKKFFISEDETIAPATEFDADMIAFGTSELELRNATEAARSAWRRMNDPAETLPVPDDAYFKRWALSKPQLPYDHIILDEAQDTNPVTFDLIRSQKRAKVLYLGDRHQSIYAFRGAVNAMEELDGLGTKLYLSKTFRFGPKIAELANTLLGDLKHEEVKITGMGRDTAFGAGQFTLLARTNGMLLRSAAARSGMGIHWIGGAQNYRINDCMDAYRLWNNDRKNIVSPAIRRFNSFNHLSNEAYEAKDREMQFLVKLVDEFKTDLPDLLQQIEVNQAPTSAEADLVFTTAHRSKGLDWPLVRLADDYDFLEKVEKQLSEGEPLSNDLVQEINLLYVALTRAKNAVSPDKKTLGWLENLDQHRQTRLDHRTQVLRPQSF